VKDALVLKLAPPVRAAYQLYVPLVQPLAESVTVPVPQRFAPVAVGAATGLQTIWLRL
jgi:hypothetical protein